MNTRKKGNLGESRACEYLIKQGYTIIERNWHDNAGEIDIIAEKNSSDNKILVICEVKTLPNGTLDMIQKELNKNKQKRILKTTKRFLLNHREYNNRIIRFDVILVDMPGFESIYHIENAFCE